MLIEQIPSKNVSLNLSCYLRGYIFVEGNFRITTPWHWVSGGLDVKSILDALHSIVVVYFT